MEKEEEKIKKAFAAVKQDINFIFNELLMMRRDLETIKKELEIAKNMLKSSYKHVLENSNTFPTHFQHISNTPLFPMQNKEKIEGNKPYFSRSKGNEGVPTHFQHISNRSTSILRQIKTNLSPISTIQQNQQNSEIQAKTFKEMQESQQLKQLQPQQLQQPQQQQQRGQQSQEQQEHLQSLGPLQQQEQENKAELEKIEHMVNNYKKILARRFKSLTKKEFEIFVLIYSMQQAGLKISYKTLAEKTGLAPSSVRDLVNRLILKGIPIQKECYHSKEVFLSIPREILKISSLEALEQLD
ncbi:MAG: hypothetical protein QW199_01255 [Candidatus Pacearchaeota archaeon]